MRNYHPILVIGLQSPLASNEINRDLNLCLKGFPLFFRFLGECHAKERIDKSAAAVSIINA